MIMSRVTTGLVYHTAPPEKKPPRVVIIPPDPPRDQKEPQFQSVDPEVEALKERKLRYMLAGGIGGAMAGLYSGLMFMPASPALCVGMMLGGMVVCGFVARWAAT